MEQTSHHHIFRMRKLFAGEQACGRQGAGLAQEVGQAHQDQEQGQVAGQELLPKRAEHKGYCQHRYIQDYHTTKYYYATSDHANGISRQANLTRSWSYLFPADKISPRAPVS